MFLNKSTQLWTFWDEGQYYDFTYEIWRNWDGKWDGYCMGQNKWFTWNESSDIKVFDLESMECISEWSSTKLQILNPQYSIDSIWRLPQYYVDPLSTEIIELGTIKYPYKSMRAVTSEILNIYSNLNINITVYLKENEDVYISDLTSYFIINITSIKVMSYSDTKNALK